MLKTIRFSLIIAIILSGSLFYSCHRADDGNKAKYVFYFIGDGMGLQQINTTQAYLAAISDTYGNKDLSFTSFPVTGFATTYAANRYITGSAAAGTALATGSKTSINTLGLNAERTDTLFSIAYHAHKAGFKVGIATSVSIDHATPAAFYAHQPDRNMYHEVAHDMVKSGFRFFAGGGFLDPEGEKSKNPLGNVFEKGLAENFYLTQTFPIPDSILNAYSSIVYSVPEPDASSTLKCRIDADSADVTLADITSLAIDVLMNPKGFFLMVEGGKIDWACHNNDAATTVGEVISLSDAIAIAVDFYNKHPNETLIVVTADHETGGMTIGNGSMKYETNFTILANQKQSIDGFNKKVLEFKTKHKSNPTFNSYLQFVSDELNIDPKAYNEMQLSYLQKAHLASLKQNNPRDKEANRKEYGSFDPMATAAIRVLNQRAGLGWTTMSHTGAQVPVYAIGVGQEMFSGNIDNTDIPKGISRAMGVDLP